VYLVGRPGAIRRFETAAAVGGAGDTDDGGADPDGTQRS
jgi:hypothetical protein